MPFYVMMKCMDFSRFDFIVHPAFGLGIITSIERNGYCNIYFFNDESKTVLFDFVKEKCAKPTNKITLEEVLKHDLTSYIFPSSVIGRGSKYISDSRIKIISEDLYTISAEIIGTYRYRTTIRIKDNSLLLDCSCPVGEECKHTYALMKYLYLKSKGEEIRSPFETEFRNLLFSSSKDYFQLGFALINSFKNNPDQNIQVVKKFLDQYDYFTNRALVPLLLDTETGKILYSILKNEYYLKMNKIRQRYLNAIDGRNRSVEDLIIAHVFLRKYEELLRVNFVGISNYSSLSKYGILFAFNQIEKTIQTINIINKLSLDKEEIREIYNSLEDIELKRMIYYNHESMFNDLPKEELEKLELSCHDLFDIYLNTSPLSRPDFFLKHYQTFLRNNELEYLPSKDILGNPIHVRVYINKLLEVIDELEDNSLLLKIDFKSSTKEINEVLYRWRDYDY